jgi:hypothetical protein
MSRENLLQKAGEFNATGSSVATYTDERRSIISTTTIPSSHQQSVSKVTHIQGSLTKSPFSENTIGVESSMSRHYGGQSSNSISEVNSHYYSA